MSPRSCLLCVDLETSRQEIEFSMTHVQKGQLNPCNSQEYTVRCSLKTQRGWFTLKAQHFNSKTVT